MAGNTLHVCVCGDCKTNLEKIMGFAQAFPKAAASTPAGRDLKPRARKAAAKVKAVEKVDPKFESHALSEGEIARTQALRPTVRLPDTPRARQMDDIDSINRGERVRVFCMAATPKMRASRERKIISKAQSELGTINVKCVKDDGFEAVFEAA